MEEVCACFLVVLWWGWCGGHTSTLLGLGVVMLWVMVALLWVVVVKVKIVWGGILHMYITYTHTPPYSRMHTTHAFPHIQFSHE